MSIEYCGKCTEPDFIDCECIGIDQAKVKKLIEKLKMYELTLHKIKNYERNSCDEFSLKVVKYLAKEALEQK